MIHGLCGVLNPRNVCMDRGKCTKYFPRKFCSETKQFEHSYPELRRRAPDQGGHSYVTEKSGKEYFIDNSWVVPYNWFLSLKYNAHINVEVCNTIKSIKYLHKYVNKGPTKAILEHSAISFAVVIIGLVSKG